MKHGLKGVNILFYKPDTDTKSPKAKSEDLGHRSQVGRDSGEGKTRSSTREKDSTRLKETTTENSFYNTPFFL